MNTEFPRRKSIEHHKEWVQKAVRTPQRAGRMPMRSRGKTRLKGTGRLNIAQCLRIIYNVHEWVLKAAQVPHQSILMVLHRPAKWQYNSLQCIDWPKWQVPKDHLSSKKFGNVISLFEIYVKSSFACLNASCFQNTAADKRGHRRWTRCPGWGVLICGVRHLWAENVERTVKLGQIHSIW